MVILELKIKKGLIWWQVVLNPIRSTIMQESKENRGTFYIQY
jgi:hypothetical protein